MKKIINILVWALSIVSVLLLSYGYILRNNPDKLPVWIVESHNDRISADSKKHIDEILALCEKKHYEAYAYSIQLIFDYGDWLNDHKTLIDQRLELKAAIIAQIKEAIKILNSMAQDAQNKDDEGVRKISVVGFFNKYLRDLQ